MMPLKEKLESRIERLKREITSKENALKRAQIDLENLASTEKRLAKQREKRVSKVGATRTIPEESPALNEDSNEVAPAGSGSEKKSKLTFW